MSFCLCDQFNTTNTIMSDQPNSTSSEYFDSEDLTCAICLEISVTYTTCNHSLCKKCYKAVITHTERNMRRCPLCRDEKLSLDSTTRALTDKQRELHYLVLLEYFNEMNAVAINSLKQLKLMSGLNCVFDQDDREIDYSCPIYDANRVSMGTLRQIRDISYNKTVVNKHGFVLGDVDNVILYYDTDATYFKR